MLFGGGVGYADGGQADVKELFVSHTWAEHILWRVRWWRRAGFVLIKYNNLCCTREWVNNCRCTRFYEYLYSTESNTYCFSISSDKCISCKSLCMNASAKCSKCKNRNVKRVVCAHCHFSFTIHPENLL